MRPIILLALAFCSAAQAAPIPASAESWDCDPMQCKFRKGEIQCALSNGNVFAETRLPRSARVKISAKFRVDRVVTEDWSTAGVALVDDEQNFWHIALVKAPKENGGGQFFELCEMRGGEWLSQTNLKTASEETRAPWQAGRTYTISLVSDPQGIAGIVEDGTGKTIFQKRFLFSAIAVTNGIPSLHVNGGFQGAFKDVEVEVSDPVPAAAKQAAFPPYQCGSFVSPVKGPAAGFFRVRQNPDGRWWVIDPLGRGVVLMGVDHVTFWGHYCEKLNLSPHHEKNKKKYASKAQWEEETLARLKGWGFNFLGAGCDSALKHRGLIHTVFLSLGDTLAYSSEEYYITPNEHRPCSGFPNVFHPDFQAYCEYRAKKLCSSNKDDPWLFGYFIDNELAWWGRGSLDTGLFDTVMKKAAAHTSKTALRDFLAGRADNDIAAFNKTWGTRLKGFDEILSLASLPSGTPERVAAKRDFLRLAAERYFSVCSAAIHRADPNHLVLGARFAGTGGAHRIVWEVSGKYCDVVTFNCYPWADLDEGVVYMDQGRNAERAADHFAKYYDYVKKPMLITEWSFPALDAGLPSCHGAGQRFRTQAERTEAASLFARTMLSLPFLVGYDYFMWVDEPALGISHFFPEDSNYGLINEDGVPYPLLTSMFAGLQKDAGEWRMRPLPEAKEISAPKTYPDAGAFLKKITAGEAGNKKTEFTREGGAFRLTAPSGLTLAGGIGQRNMVASITWEGRPFGAYNAMVCLQAPRWIDATRVTDVQYRQEAGCGVLELTSEYPEQNEGFAVTHRLTVLPDRPVMVCELVRIVNKAKRPLALKSAYFRLYAPFHDKAKDAVPNLWKGAAKACWMDAGDGRFIGFCAPENAGAFVQFWAGASGDLHPDACYELGESTVLPVGAVYTPSRPMFMACALGTDGEQGWNKLTDSSSCK